SLPDTSVTIHVVPRPRPGLPQCGGTPRRPCADGRHYRRALAALAVVLTLVGPAIARTRHSKSAPDLVHVITPSPRATVPAHPDVNVIVQFSDTSGANPTADPGSVRARLNARDVTSLFQPMTDQGVQVGLRAALRHGELKLGRHRTNRLRLIVRARGA